MIVALLSIQALRCLLDYTVSGSYKQTFMVELPQLRVHNFYKQICPLNMQWEP